MKGKRPDQEHRMGRLKELERRETRVLEKKFAQLIGWERAKKRERLLLSALFYSVLASFLFLPLGRSLPIEVDPIALPAIFFFIFAPTLLLFQRPREHESLQSVYLMDKRLGLEDRAVTGWEIIGRNPIEPAERLVLKEAEERLRDVNPRSLLKRRFAWQFVFAPLVFVLWFALLGLDFGAGIEKGVKASQPDSAVRKLRDFSISLKEKAESQGLAESLKIAFALKDLAEKKLVGQMTESNLKESLAGLVKRIEGLERGAGKESAPFFPGATEESLADLKAELNALRPGFPPNSPGRETKPGADLLGKINNLPRLREELQRERLSTDELGEDELKSFLDKLDAEVSGELELRALVETHDFVGDLLKEFGERPASAEVGIAGQAQKGRLSEGKKMTAKGDAPGDEPGTMRDLQALPPFKGTAFTRLKGLIGEGKSRSLTLRGEPAAGKSKVPQEKVIASYRRQVEEELSTEQIPEERREAVKRYFLSLGMGGEKK